MVTVTTLLVSIVQPLAACRFGQRWNRTYSPGVAGAARVQGRVHAVSCGSPHMRNRREMHATDVAGCSDALQRMWLDVAMRCDGCGWM